MKVYVDELPKECFGCPCFRNDIEFPCGLSDGTNDYFLDEIDGGNCPLQTIADHDKEVRKQVCDGLAISLIKHFSKEAEFTVEEICNWLQEVKNQIEKGGQE